MKVNECMCKNVICANEDTTITDIAKLMSDNHVGCIPICDFNKNVIGLITDRDIILRTVACNKDANATKAKDIMTTKVYKVNATDDISEASKTMCDCQVRRIPVTEGSTLVGILTLGDLANNDNVNATQVSNTVEGICNCHNPKNSM